MGLFNLIFVNIRISLFPIFVKLIGLKPRLRKSPTDNMLILKGYVSHGKTMPLLSLQRVRDYLIGENYSENRTDHLAFIAQGWHLAMFDTLLFDGSIMLAKMAA